MKLRGFTLQVFVFVTLLAFSLLFPQQTHAAFTFQSHSLSDLTPVTYFDVEVHPHGSTPHSLSTLGVQAIQFIKPKSSMSVTSNASENHHGKTLDTPFGQQVTMNILVDKESLSFKMAIDNSVFDETSTIIAIGSDGEPRYYTPSLSSYRGVALDSKGNEVNAHITITPRVAVNDDQDIATSAGETTHHTASSIQMSAYLITGGIVDRHHKKSYDITTFYQYMVNAQDDIDRLTRTVALKQAQFEQVLQSIDGNANIPMALTMAASAASTARLNDVNQNDDGNDPVYTTLEHTLSSLGLGDEYYPTLLAIQESPAALEAYNSYVDTLAMSDSAQSYLSSLQSMSAELNRVSPYGVLLTPSKGISGGDSHDHSHEDGLHTHDCGVFPPSDDEQDGDTDERVIPFDSSTSPFDIQRVIQSWSDCHLHQTKPGVRRTRLTLRLAVDYGFSLYSSTTKPNGEPRLDAVVANSAGILQQVNIVYDSLIQVVFTIKVLDVRLSPTAEEWNYTSEYCDTSTILNTFTTTYTPLHNRDTALIHLFTACSPFHPDNPATSYTVGTAYYSAVCAQRRSSGGWSNLRYGQWTTVAHEFGHHQNLHHTFSSNTDRGDDRSQPQYSGMGIMDYGSSYLFSEITVTDPNHNLVTLSHYSDSRNLCLLYTLLFDEDDAVYSLSPYSYRRQNMKTLMIDRQLCYSIEYNPPSLCGNGVVDPGEECDSGATPSPCCSNCRLTQGSTCEPLNNGNDCCVNCRHHIGTCGPDGRGFCDVFGRCQGFTQYGSCVDRCDDSIVNNKCYIPCMSPDGRCTISLSLNRLHVGAPCMSDDRQGVCTEQGDGSFDIVCAPLQYTWIPRVIQKGCNCEENALYSMTYQQCVDQANNPVSSSFCHDAGLTRPADQVTWCNCFPETDPRFRKEWYLHEYSTCDAECGTGTQTLITQPSCTLRLSGDPYYYKVIPDAECASLTPPPSSQPCSPPPANCGTKETGDFGYTCENSKCVCRNNFSGHLCRISPEYQLVHHVYPRNEPSVAVPGTTHYIRWTNYGSRVFQTSVFFHFYNRQKKWEVIPLSYKRLAINTQALIAYPAVPSSSIPNQPQPFLTVGANSLFMKRVNLTEPVRALCEKPSDEEIFDRDALFMDCGANGECDLYTSECICKPGWGGRTCDRELTCGICHPDNTEACELERNNVPRCICKPGFGGETCSESICDVLGCPSSEKIAECSAETAFTCQCVNQYYGPSCTRSICYDGVSAVFYGGDVHNHVNNYYYHLTQKQCVCKNGLVGEYCHIPDSCANAVENMECVNGVVALQTPNDCDTATCQCRNYWSKTPVPPPNPDGDDDHGDHDGNNSEAASTIISADTTTSSEVQQVGDDQSCSYCLLQCTSDVAISTNPDAECLQCQCQLGFYSPQCTCPEIYPRIVLNHLPEPFQVPTFIPSKVYTDWNQQAALNHFPKDDLEDGAKLVNEIEQYLTRPQLDWLRNVRSLLIHASQTLRVFITNPDFVLLRVRFLPQSKDSVFGRFVLEYALRMECNDAPSFTSLSATSLSNKVSLEDSQQQRRRLHDLWISIQSQYYLGRRAISSIFSSLSSPFYPYSSSMTFNGDSDYVDYRYNMILRDVFDPHCEDEVDSEKRVLYECPRGWNPAKISKNDPDFGSGGDGLSTAVIIVIAVVCAVLVLAIIGIVIYCILQRRKTSSGGSTSEMTTYRM